MARKYTSSGMSVSRLALRPGPGAPRLSPSTVPGRCRPRDGTRHRAPGLALGRQHFPGDAYNSRHPLRDAHDRVAPPDTPCRTPDRLPALPTPPRSRTGCGPAHRIRGWVQPGASSLSGTGSARERPRTRVPFRRGSGRSRRRRWVRGKWHSQRTRTGPGRESGSARAMQQWSRARHRLSGRREQKSVARSPPRGAGAPNPRGRESGFDCKRALDLQGCQLQSINIPQEDEWP